jgi:hypothetical protein
MAIEGFDHLGQLSTRRRPNRFLSPFLRGAPQAGVARRGQ